MELVEICNLSPVAGGFVKIWGKCLECVLKVCSAALIALALHLLRSGRSLRGMGNSKPTSEMEGWVG